MKTISKLTILGTLATACATAAPEIRSILNGASFAPTGAPNSAVAQGSVFVVKGTELGPAVLREASGFPLQTTLGGVSVRITVGATAVDAPLLYVSASQVSGILPSTAPPGIGLLAVTYEGHTSQSGAFRILRSSPGILTQNQAGTGAALAQNFNSESDQPRNSVTKPARPGQVITLWATGLGPIADSDAAQPAPRELDVNLQVLVGGRPATVLSKTRSSCCAGTDHIKFEVPRDVDGCYVPVVVRAGDVVSNFATISVAGPASDCVDVSGIKGPEIDKLQSGGNLRFGSITFSVAQYYDDDGMPGIYESAFAQFSTSDWPGLQSRLGIGRPAPGSCLVSPISTTGTFVGSQDPTQLETGEALNLSGPKGAKQLPRTGPGYYYQQFSESAPKVQYFEPGAYAIDNGSGGADVGAFRATFTIPPPLKTTIDRAPTATTVAWSGGDPAGYVTITGEARSPTGVATSFTCTERVSAGKFAVPLYVLSSLPVSLADTAYAFIRASSPPYSRFPAPGLDVGYILFTSSLE